MLIWFYFYFPLLGCLSVARGSALEHHVLGNALPSEAACSFFFPSLLFPQLCAHHISHLTEFLCFQSLGKEKKWVLRISIPHGNRKLYFLPYQLPRYKLPSFPFQVDEN